VLVWQGVRRGCTLNDPTLKGDRLLKIVKDSFAFSKDGGNYRLLAYFSLE
jgi:hypothetical protein